MTTEAILVPHEKSYHDDVINSETARNVAIHYFTLHKVIETNKKKNTSPGFKNLGLHFKLCDFCIALEYLTIHKAMLGTKQCVIPTYTVWKVDMA